MTLTLGHFLSLAAMLFALAVIGISSIALLLGKSPDVIKAISEAGFNGAEGDANVVVVLGPDAPPVEQSTTSTTSASGTTTTQSN